MADGGFNEKADVARRIFELCETIGEAIDHMRNDADLRRDDAGISAVMLKDVAEGLISLENAVSAVAGPLGADPEDIMMLSQEYDAMSERMDALTDACIEDRASDFLSHSGALRESFLQYVEILNRSFGKMAVM